MANNDSLQGRECQQERGGGKMTRRNTHEAPKPYDRPVSTFGRIFAAVKDILKPAFVTEAMSRIQDAQKEAEIREGVDKRGCDAGYEMLCDSSEPDEVMVEVDGYHAVFKSKVLHDEMTQLKGKLVDAVLSSEKPCEQQPSGSTLERSSSRLSSPRSNAPVVAPNTTPMSSGLLRYRASDKSLCNNVSTSSGYDTVSSTKRNDAWQEATENRYRNRESIATPSKFESTNGAQFSSYRRFGAESSAAKPAFKMSRFCESVEKIRAGTSLLSRSRAEMAALSESCAESSFYAGKTSYGGAASAYKVNSKSPVSTTSPYEMRPTVRKCVNVSGGGAETKVMSVTAQRILDTMEKREESSLYLNRSHDASICNSPLSFTPSYRRNSSQFGTARQSGPPVKQLITPSVSVLKPMRATVVEPSDTYQELRPILSDARMDTQPEPLRETGYQLPFGSTQARGFENVLSSTPGGKCKKPPKHYVSRVNNVEETQTNSALSSIKLLPAANLRSSSFDLNVEGITAVTFSFSMPKESVSDSKVTEVCAEAGECLPQSFIFSPPRIVQEVPEAEMLQSSLKSVSQTTSSAINAKFECAKLGGTGTSPAVPLTALFKKPSNIWTCAECLVDNKSTDTACVACMTPRPGVEVPADKPSISQNTAGAASGLTLNATGGFKFGTGSIGNAGFGGGFGSCAQNNGPANFSSNNSGVSGGFKFSGSCEGEKDFGSLTRPPLRSDKVKTPEQKVSTNGEEMTKNNKPLSELFKKSTNVWTCNDCYITNKNEQDRCVSCEASKPSEASKTGTSKSLPFSTVDCNSKFPDAVSKAAGNSESSNAKPLSELFKKPADSWTCGECFVVNNSTHTTCLSCDTVKPIGAAPTTSQPANSLNFVVASKPLSELFKKPVDVWSCNECYVTNKNDRTTCQSCEAAKPCAVLPPSLSSSVEGQQISNNAKPLSELFKKSADVWTCKECFVSNKKEFLRCQSCETAKPCAKPPSLFVIPSVPASQVVSSDVKPLSELFKKPSDAWTCNECYVSNKNDLTSCQSCESIKPGAQQPPSLPAVPSHVVSSDAKPLSELFKKAADVWTCSECFVTNKNDHVSCQSCETVRPGGASVPVALKTSTAQTFTFGAQNPSVFGSSTGQAAASSTFPSPSMPPFKFGQLSADANVNTENTATRPFVFGQPVPTDAVAGKSQPFTAETKAPMFGFSQPSFGAATSSLSESVETVASSSTSGFGTGFKTNLTVSTFGNSNFSAPLAGASFGSISTTPMFGSTVALPSFGVPATSAVLPGFCGPSTNVTFGAPSTNALPPFGAHAASVTLPAFGASATSDALPVHGAPVTSAKPFSFGASTPMFSSAVTSSSASGFLVDQKSIQTGFGASTSTVPAFTASTGSSATDTPQFGVFPSSFVSPARVGSIFGATSSSSGILQSGFAAPSFSSTATTSSAAPTFKFGSGDNPPASGLFTFGRQTAGTSNSVSSVRSGDGLTNNPGKRSLDESSNGDPNSAKRAVGNFSFGASSSQSGGFTFGQQFQGSAAASVAADNSGASKGFNFGTTTPMFNIPASNSLGVTAAPPGVFQFGASGEPKPPSFQNPFDVRSSTSNVGAISNRVIKRAERRLNKPRR